MHPEQACGVACVMASARSCLAWGLVLWVGVVGFGCAFPLSLLWVCALIVLFIRACWVCVAGAALIVCDSVAFMGCSLGALASTVCVCVSKATKILPMASKAAPPCAQEMLTLRADETIRPSTAQPMGVQPRHVAAFFRSLANIMGAPLTAGAAPVLAITDAHGPI